jgi:hypothetical protein
MGGMRRGLGWAAALLAVPAVQVLLGYWAYKAYKYPCHAVAPGVRPACVEHNGLNPLLLPPLWGVIALWFLVDLALLLLGLWLLQRQDTRRGAAWRQGVLRWRTSLFGAVLAVHMLLGYWWVMAYTQGPDRTTPGECPACFRRAVREQNAFEAVNPGVVFLIWVGVDLALLWFAIRLTRSPRQAPPRLSAFADPW